MPEKKDAHGRAAPRASRPTMPDYGVLDAQSGQGLLPWSWATERLASARNYWIATARPDGSPHMTPVWGVWFDDTFYFSTGRRSRKARNLAADPRCVVCPEGADEPVILEGTAERVTDPEMLGQVAAAISAKYQWTMVPTPDGMRDEHGNEGPVFAVRPHTAFGFGQDLSGSATRWSFGAE